MIKNGVPKDLKELGYHSVINIYISCEMTQNWLEYILDCWNDFVASDLGFKPRELLMIVPDYEVTPIK